MATSTDLDAQRAYYDKRWSREPYANLLQLHRTIAILDGLRKLSLTHPKILDLGCGTGWLTGVLGRFGPATGIELSPQAVENAKLRYPDVQFMAADFSSLADTTETYDVVVSQEVIEHVESQKSFVNLVMRLLRPGGYLILTTPNAWNLAHWSQPQLEEWGLQPIENWLTVKQLGSLLEPNFRIIHKRTIVLGHGTQGMFRLVNSPKLVSLLRLLGLLDLHRFLLERAGFGLHIVVVAQRRQCGH